MKLTSFDLTKAFDCVPHHLLLRRLREVEDLPPGFISWLADYLTNRKQRVKLGRTLSSEAYVSSGVPQGSILGPYLFAVYFSRVQLNSASHGLLDKYADDMSTVHPMNKHNIHESLDSLKTDTEDLIHQVEELGLRLNETKSKCLTISLKEGHIPDHPIVSEVDSLKLLGVTFDRRLKWSLHFHQTLKKCSRGVFALRKLAPFKTSIKLDVVYCATVRSILEYAALLFVGMSKSHKKNSKSFNRAMKIINSDLEPL